MKKLFLFLAIIVLLLSLLFNGIFMVNCSSPNNIKAGSYKIVEIKLMDGKSHYPYQYVLKKVSNVSILCLYYSDEKLMIGQTIKL